MNTKENIPMLVIDSAKQDLLCGGWEARVTLGFIGGGPTENPPFLDIDDTQGLERCPLAGDIVWVRPPQVVGFLDERFEGETQDGKTQDTRGEAGPPWPGGSMAAAMGKLGNDELPDEHPLWCVNSQITDLLEGNGASEDHENVIRFFRETGLPAGTVARIHRAIVCAEKTEHRREEAGPPWPGSWYPPSLEAMRDALREESEKVANRLLARANFDLSVDDVLGQVRGIPGAVAEKLTGRLIRADLQALREKLANGWDSTPVGELGGVDCSHGKEVQL